MKAIYYVIEIYKGGKLHTVVEHDDFSRVAKFTIDSELLRVKTHGECLVKISVATSGSRHLQLIEQFKAVGMDQIKNIALSYKVPEILCNQAR
jgi:hypothetical protein